MKIFKPGTLAALVFGLSAILAPCVSAQENELKIPAEVAPFVEQGTKALAVEKGDLNGDGKDDYVVALEKESPAKDENGMPTKQRPLLILVRGADGKLSVAKRNERIVMCSECGGVFGDPFDGIFVKRNTFTVHHYGGSNWRWSYDYTFNYSRIDKTWQLVRVKEYEYHTSNPNKGKTKIYTPANFGKIDVADFDPDNYLKKTGGRKSK